MQTHGRKCSTWHQSNCLSFIQYASTVVYQLRLMSATVFNDLIGWIGIQQNIGYGFCIHPFCEVRATASWRWVKNRTHPGLVTSQLQWLWFSQRKICKNLVEICEMNTTWNKDSNKSDSPFHLCGLVFFETLQLVKIAPYKHKFRECV